MRQCNAYAWEAESGLCRHGAWVGLGEARAGAGGRKPQSGVGGACVSVQYVPAGRVCTTFSIISCGQGPNLHGGRSGARAPGGSVRIVVPALDLWWAGMFVPPQYRCEA